MTGNNMKYIHKFTTLTLCAVLLLSGCNTDKAVTTTTDTSTVTEEVTTTEATTAASTTTTSATTTMTTTKTTTAPKEPELPESDFGCFLQDDGTVYISWYEGSDKDVIIPEYIGKYPVTSMMLPLWPESHFNGKEYVPDNGTEIETVTLPKTMTRLQFHEYYEFQTIKSYIVDPENEKYTAVDGVLYSKDMTKLVLYPPAKEGEFTVPESVTEIGSGSFSHTDKITAVNIGGNVRTIGMGAFERSSVSEVNIAEGLESVEWCAFLASNIESIVLPKTVRKIEARAFELSKLRSITLPTAIDEFGTAVFAKTELSEINLIDNGEGLYMWNDILRKGDELIRMIKGSNVEKLILDRTFTSKDVVFEGCTGLKVIEILDGCDFIISNTIYGDFWDCPSIERLYIPASVVSAPFYHYYQSMSPDLVVYTPENGGNSFDLRNSGDKCRFVFVDSYDEYLKVTSENG